MTQQADPMLNAILERLAAKRAAADSSRDLAHPINRARMARDLVLVDWPLDERRRSGLARS